MGNALTATDPDPNMEPLIYTLSGADAGSFRVRQDNGQIEVGAGTKLDYEAAKNVYMVTLTAEDSFGASPPASMVTIMVTDMDEAPDISGDAAIEYDENGTGLVATYTAVDPDGTAITSWTVRGTDADVFDIAGGVLTFKKAPDYEDPGDVVGGGDGSTAAANDNSYEVTVEAMDRPARPG